jgi:hypothetical protein
MRRRTNRHIGSLLNPPSADVLVGKSSPSQVNLYDSSLIPVEFSPRQYVIMLLHLAAEIEHSLMVEYLYAAYSLGGPGIPKGYREKVARWKEWILGIAKEEMGHLMTIQNFLRCLGGALHVDREDYPWNSEFSPFPFQLEPLTRHSLAKYVFAESPGPTIWNGAEADEVHELARIGVGSGPLNRVGELYSRLHALSKDETLLSDEDFRSSTFEYQANWDEWGRGYQGGARGNTMGAAIPGTPTLILKAVTSRSDALQAIKLIALQGEANVTADAGAPSHFSRFLRIFREWPKDAAWSPTHAIPRDPFVTTNSTQIRDGSQITHPESTLWASLFNVRYQILLTCLLHTFDYPNSTSQASHTGPRGFLLNAIFGEMYNLRAISQILVRKPLSLEDSTLMAGPPFQMPHTLELPRDGYDRWNLHLDLLLASSKLTELLGYHVGHDDRPYLSSLHQADSLAAGVVRAIWEHSAHKN